MGKPRIRIRFSVKMLAVTLAVACLGLGLFAIRLNQVRMERGAGEVFERAGGSVAWGLVSDILEEKEGINCPEVVVDERPEEGAFVSFGRSLFDGIIQVELQETSIDQVMFAAIHSLPNLALLEMSSCKFEEPVLERERLPAKIRYFRLRETPLRLANSQFFANSQCLEWLELSSCGIDDSQLAQLSPLSQLRVLDLSGNAITDLGLECLRYLRNLEALDLSGNSEITDAGLQHLSYLKSLKQLRVVGADVSEDEVHSLKRKLPKAKIYFNSYVATKTSEGQTLYLIQLKCVE